MYLSVAVPLSKEHDSGLWEEMKQSQNQADAHRPREALDRFADFYVVYSTILGSRRWRKNVFTFFSPLTFCTLFYLLNVF